MDSFFKKAQQALEQVVESQSQSSGGDRNQGQGGGSSIRLPGPVVEWVEKYVDSARFFLSDV